MDDPVPSVNTWRIESSRKTTWLTNARFRESAMDGTETAYIMKSRTEWWQPERDSDGHHSAGLNE
ncbi:MAG: hypothetical protein ACK58L_13430 [Planctomycetota bacterium]